MLIWGLLSEDQEESCFCIQEASDTWVTCVLELTHRYNAIYSVEGMYGD